MTENPTEPTPKTHVLAVIDNSGSMRLLAGDVCGGFNAYLETLRADTEIDYTVTVVLFNSTSTVLADAVPAGDAPELTPENYQTMGSTALNDAIMTTILRFQAAHAELQAHETVILIINTDGHENFSREHNSSEVRAALAELAETGKWAVLFMGTGPEAWSVGSAYGHKTVILRADSDGTRSGYVSASAATLARSRGASADDTYLVAASTAAAEQQQQQ